MPHGRNRGSLVGQHRRRSQRNKAYLNYVKDSAGCLNCGGFENLVFHHRRDKVDKLSQLAHQAGIEKLMNEIAKCDVLCESCHNTLHSKPERNQYEKDHT